MESIDSSAANVGSAQAVARTVLLRGPISRSDVARRLGLSPASMTRLARPLIEQGLLIEDESVANPVHGRLVRPLDVSPALRFVGIKISIDSVHGVLTDARASVLRSARKSLASTDSAVVVDAVSTMIVELSEGQRVQGVGVSLGGHTDDRSAVVLSRSLGWRGVPLGDQLSAASGVPVTVENDVTALTVAQHLFSAECETDRFALVTVGVGVGCGLVINGDVVRQADAASPSPSMLVLNPSGPVVPEGPRGSALAYLASTNVAIAASTACGRPLTFDEAMSLARAGDPRALSIITEAGSYLGRFIASIATINYISKFILSGEGIAIAEIARPAMLDAIAASRPEWSASLDIDVVPTTMSDWARGAAAVAITRMIDTYSPADRW